MTKVNCDKWKENKERNPLTNKKLSKTSMVLFTSLCKNKKLCKEFKKNSNINPVTKRKLSDSSKIAKMIGLICLETNDFDAKKNAKDYKEESKEEINKENPLGCTEYSYIKLKPHQIKVCKYINKHKTKGIVLFHGVGSGKTLSSITIIRCLLQREPDQKVFVITPTSLVDNFLKELNKVNVKFGKNVIVTTHGKFVKRIESEGTDFCKDSVLIVDEAHKFNTILKYSKGKSTKLLMQGTSVAKQVFLLTATPIMNNPIEFANLYAMITKKEKYIKKLYKLFEESNYSDLKRLFKNKISYFKNKDSSDYPSVTYKNIKFYMTKEYYKLYKAIENNESELFKDLHGTNNLSIFYNGIRRAANAIDNNITTPKIEWSISHIKDSIKNKKKVLIYSTWLNSGLKLIQNKLDEEKIEWVEVNGSMSILKRTRAVNKYNRGDVLVLFISSAGAEGLDLKGTRSIIILEPHWNNEKIKQVVGRGVRYKSHSDLPLNQRHVDVYHLITRKPKNNKDTLLSADEYLQKISDKKDKVILEFYDALIDSSI
jgi:superfamily II DNA or RNA helicase